MASDYATIRADNERRYGTDIGRIGPMLLSDRYDDRTHFIFELLQNAEDAFARRPEWRGRRSVTFHLSPADLRVTHFGKPFDTLDVRGVCGIAESTKDLTAIGRFGIGFKSVYAFTNRPEVHSGSEDFAIENFVWPTAAPPVQRGPDETTFVLPAKANDPDALEEITGGLKRLGPRTLLFLRQIEEISWSVDGGPSGLYMRGEPDDLGDNVRRLTLIGEGEGRTEIEEHWLVFSQEVTAPGGSHAGQVEIAFSLAGADAGDGRSTTGIQPVVDSPLVVFFPTVIATHLGFLLQGPFRTTPSRDNVPKDDPWNSGLVQESASLLVRALRSMRDRGLLDAATLRCLPLDRSRLGEGRFAPLFEAARAALAKESLLPRFGGGHTSASAARLARTQELRELFDGRQLARLFGVDGDFAWLSADITQDRTPELRQYLMQELNVPEVTPTSILPRLDRAFLEEQSDAWIRRLYEFLNGQPALLVLLKDMPLVRLRDGTHVRAHQDGQPRAFLPGTLATGFPTVRAEVCATGAAKEFLKSLKLTEPDPVDDVTHNVLPKYRREEVDVTDAEYEADIGRIVTAFGTDSKTQREKLVTALRDTSFVMTVDAGDRSKWVSKPANVYLATDRLKSLFAGVPGVFLVDDEYPCLRGEDVRTLLESCGAGRTLQPMPAAARFDWQQKHAMRVAAGCESTSGGETIDDYTLRGLDELIAALPRLDATIRRERATLLWDALRDVVERRGASAFSGTYRWFYYHGRVATFDAACVELLNSSAWVVDASGEVKQPEFVLFEQLGWKADPLLLSKIRFKPPIIEALAREAGIDPRVLEILKKHGITSEAELVARLGMADESEGSSVGGQEGGSPLDAEGEPEDTEEPAAAGGATASGDGAREARPDAGSHGTPGDGRAGGGSGPPHWGGGAEHGAQARGGDSRGAQSAPDGDGGRGRREAGEPRGGRPFVSYVAADAAEEGPDPDGLEQEARMALEEKAIALILQSEPHLKRTPANNPGYDLYEPGPEGDPLRWIEVKGMKRDLYDRPVGISRTQFECAREHGERFCLYVVEHADDPARARVVRIVDPVGKARTFTFDHGWLAIAEGRAEASAGSGDDR